MATGVLRSAGTAAAAAITDYDGFRENARRALYASLGSGADPGRAARRIVTAARNRHPLPWYGVGAGARGLPPVRVPVPQRVLDRVVARAFGLHR